MFDSNAVWAIVIIVLNAVGFLFQGLSNLASLSSGDRADPSYTSTAASSTPEVSVIIAIIILVFIIVAIVLVISVTINVFIQGMFSYVALESEKGRAVSFSEAFNATAKRFWALLSAQLLAMIKIFGWTLLFIVPGIIAALRYALLPYLVMADNSITHAGDAHGRVKELTKGRLWEVFGVSTVAAIIPVIGTVLGLSGKAALYNQLASHKERPKIHWLNYIGLVILALVLIIVTLFILVIVLVSSTTR
jgi:uncharacterized membrane protein YidH (DUF202 family)